MSSFSTRKRWAVWLIIAWLATGISVWAIEMAGNGRLQERVCRACRGASAKEDPCELQGKGLALELARDESKVREILRRDQAGDDPVCVRNWLKARIGADFLLIPSYSALMAFIVLLLAAPRHADDRAAGLLWSVVGILLALAMLVADAMENCQMLRLIAAEDGQALRLLWPSMVAKWGAIALASALAGILALIRRSGWLTIPIGLLGLATSAVLTVGLLLESQSLVSLGGVAFLFVLFTLALIHAVAVVVRPDPENEERNS